MTKATTSAVHAVEEPPERPWRVEDRAEGDGDGYEIRVTVYSLGALIEIYEADTGKRPKLDFDAGAARAMAEGLINAADLADLIESKRR
jgi:hypothetical protein